MTDFLPNQNPSRGLLDLESVFTYFFLIKVQCKYKRTLRKINYFRVTPYKFKHEQRLITRIKSALQCTTVAMDCSVVKVFPHRTGDKKEPQDTESGLVDLFATPILRPQFCKDLGPQSGEAIQYLINASMCLNSNLSTSFSALVI